MGVMRLGYVHIRVTGLERAVNHYVDTLGLRLVAERDGKAYLKAWDEYDHHSIVLEQGGSGLARLGYKCEAPEDLAVIERRAQSFGATVARVAKGENLAVGEGVRVTLPSGQIVELYADMEYLGTDTGTLNPDPWPRDLRGMGVPRLDHVAIGAEDPATTERFFIECLQFRPSERAVTHPSDPQLLASFLYCSDRMHDVALLKGPDQGLHHVAFSVEGWDQILRAGDVCAMDDVAVDYGPARHGIGRTTTLYFFDPDGNRNEVTSGGYRTGPDFPTITWTGDQLAKGIFYIQREISDRFLGVYT